MSVRSEYAGGLSPAAGESAPYDSFVRDRLPSRDRSPILIAERPEYRFPDRLNAAAELLDRHIMDGRGHRRCLITDTAVWTYGDLFETTNRIARVLTEDFGLIPGNRVLLRAPNSPLLVACWLAVVKAGGVAVTTMPLLRARELAQIADKAQISLALCDERIVGELYAARDRAPVLRTVLPFADDLRARMAAKSPIFDPAETAADDPCLITFTSGTTGQPKAAVHFHRDLLTVTEGLPRHVLAAGPDDVFCGSSSLAFVYGLGALLLFPLRVGAASALIEQPTPEALLRTIRNHRATLCFSVPRLYRSMLDRIDGFDLSSLRACVSAAEALPRSVFDLWRAATGLPILDSIGSTEMLHTFIAATPDALRPGATGKPLPGYRAIVVDDDFRPLPPGEVGRLAIRGPVGCRYLEDPHQTDYVQHGWNLTGDAFLVDEDGYFWHQCRTDDMIVSAGYNISGLEVEEVLLEHPLVSECAVVASPDPERTFVPKAFVVLQNEVRFTDGVAEQLQEFVKTQIAPYKYPRAIEFLPELPRTETGKIMRYKLRDLELQRSGVG
jgi:2-aminobenzoate-CoA ligase